MPRQMKKAALWMAAVLGLLAGPGATCRAGIVYPDASKFGNLSDFTSTAGTYTITSTATGATLTGNGLNLNAYYDSTYHMAIFQFNSINLGADTVIKGDGGTGSLPVALLSLHDINIASGGRIDFSGQNGQIGAAGVGGAGGGNGGAVGMNGDGPGKGLYDPNGTPQSATPYGGGGGFGGKGGGDEANSGLPYGDLSQQLQGGSGGAGGNTGSSGGGGGGGAIQLGALGNITLGYTTGGTILAKGGNSPNFGANRPTDSGGAGSGGGILIAARGAVNLDPLGDIILDASGGNTSNRTGGGGGGGGGRVLIEYGTTITLDAESYGSAGSGVGGGGGGFAGTVVVRRGPNSVPEPSTVALGLMMVLAAGGFLWKQRAGQAA